VIWVGGLVTLALLAPQIARTAGSLSARDQGGPELLGTLLRRYSLLAGLALATVVASGVVNAELRVATFVQLFTTDYGLMIVFKVTATAVLAVVGWMHRSWVIPRLAGSHLGPSVRPGAERGASDAAEADEGSSQASAPGATRFTTTKLLWQMILVEVAIMASVIGVSSVLGRTAPPVPDELPPGATPTRILTGYTLPPEQSL